MGTFPAFGVLQKRKPTILYDRTTLCLQTVRLKMNEATSSLRNFKRRFISFVAGRILPLLFACLHLSLCSDGAARRLPYRLASYWISCLIMLWTDGHQLSMGGLGPVTVT